MPKKTETTETAKQHSEGTPSQVAHPVPHAPPAQTEGEKIWNEIKDRTINMFALPDQVVFQHCTFIPIEPSKCYVTIRSTATLPSLEAAIGAGFTVELADKFVVIARAVKPLGHK